MRGRYSLAGTLVLSFLTSASGLGRQAGPPPSQTSAAKEKQTSQPNSKDDVVRISVTLVQVDAVVVDDKGRAVTDLSREDFEIFADGRPQRISNFSYIATQPASPPRAVKNDKEPIGEPPPLRPEQTGRTIALVVDDLGLSFESASSVHNALKKFVDEQMQPGDLVAIVRTGTSMGALQQFTSDKRLLYAAIERVRWNPNGRGGLGPFAAIDADPVEEERAQQGLGGPASTSDSDRAREDIFAVGTLGALNFVVRGLKDLPGRKSVILFSDGFRLLNREGGHQRVLDALQRLTDQANRASVVIYSIDARGIQVLNESAADNTMTMHQDVSPDKMQAALNERKVQFVDSQEGLNYLAQQTGGFLVRNRNDLSGGVSRVLEDQTGYYLIGYVPDEAVFKSEHAKEEFHKITVKVKRAGLRVRSRTGFYGVTDEAARSAPQTHAEQMLTALTSPFASSNLHLRLTSMLGNDPKAGSFLRSLLYIDGRDVSFSEEPEGWRKAALDILLVTFGDNGALVDRINRTYNVRVRGDDYKEVLRGGLVFTVNLPIKNAGPYQLRAAVRDASTQHVGSAGQFVQVPDLNKGRLTLSGIVVQGRDPAAQTAVRATEAKAAPSGQSEPPSAEDSPDKSDPQANPAVRKFRPGMVLDYNFLVFNARLSRSTRLPQLETQMIIYRDGKKVYTGEVTPFDPGKQSDWRRITASGSLHLAKGIKPGEYVLQIKVTDKLADQKRSLAARWVDYEIVQ